MKSFSERIALILQHYQLQPKDLAEKCGVQRSAISHLINGRNRPSVTFLSTLSDMYPELDTRWLLHGKGEMFTSVTLSLQNNSDTSVNTVVIEKEEQVDHTERDTTVSESLTNDLKDIDSIPYGKDKTKPSLAKAKEIQRIIVFYNDGTFESYNPQAD